MGSREDSCNTNHPSGNPCWVVVGEVTSDYHEGAVCPRCVHPHTNKAKIPGVALRHDRETDVNDCEVSHKLCDLWEHATCKASEDSDPVLMYRTINVKSEANLACTICNAVSVPKVCRRSHEGIPCKHYVNDFLIGKLRMVDELETHSWVRVDVREMSTGEGKHVSALDLVKAVM